MPHGKQRIQLMDTGKISYTFQLCDKAYFLEYALKLHFRQSHSDEEMGEGDDDFICPFCKKLLKIDFKLEITEELFIRVDKFFKSFYPTQF